MKDEKDELINQLEESIKAFLDSKLHDQLIFFNSKENPKSSKKIRSLNFTIKENVFREALEINAYAIYTEKEDIIIMTRGMFSSLCKLFLNNESDLGHAMWMILSAIYFCVSHELSHLYAGHCQLAKENKLAISYNSQTGLSYLTHQSLEMDADTIASGRIAELVNSHIQNKQYLNFYYDNEELFYSDTIKAICCFFYFLKSIEGDHHINYNFSTHPPSFERCFFTLLKFNEHYKYYFTDMTKIFMDSFFDNLLDKNEYYKKSLNVNPFIENNTFNILRSQTYQEILSLHWEKEVKQKIDAFRRLPFVHDTIKQ